MTECDQEKPIACSLGAGDYRERLAWIAELNARNLRRQRRSGLRLELAYGTAVAEDLRELIRREEACCGFLTFRLQQKHDSLLLVITAPETARSMLDSVFEPFLQTQKEGPPAGNAMSPGVLKLNA